MTKGQSSDSTPSCFDALPTPSYDADEAVKDRGKSVHPTKGTFGAVLPLSDFWH